MTLDKGERILVPQTDWKPKTNIGSNCPACATDGKTNKLLINIKSMLVFCQKNHTFTIRKLHSINNALESDTGREAIRRALELE